MILIRKILTKAGLHYYEVYKNESLDEINYYMALDEINKKILFSNDRNFTIAICIYDIESNKFILEDSRLKPLIGSYVIIQGKRAIIDNSFPQSLSWES